MKTLQADCSSLSSSSSSFLVSAGKKTCRCAAANLPNTVGNPITWRLISWINVRPCDCLFFCSPLGTKQSKRLCFFFFWCQPLAINTEGTQQSIIIQLQLEACWIARHSCHSSLVNVPSSLDPQRPPNFTVCYNSITRWHEFCHRRQLKVNYKWNSLQYWDVMLFKELGNKRVWKNIEKQCIMNWA